MKLKLIPAALVTLAGLATSNSPPELNTAELSLSDLMSLTVESVSKRSEPLIAVPAAVYVITSDDIRNYGIKRVQDALRLVPGLVLVDRSTSTNDFNIREDLVAVSTTVSFLLDGIPIQNPLFGAVYFVGLDLPIEEIDRIEVIRGNGGTVYGANSVTGVVSIYTKKAAASQGFAASLDGGGPGHIRGALRYGSKIGIGEETNWMAYGAIGYSKGYDADGSTFKGDSVWAKGKSYTKLADGTFADSSYRIANRFTSDKTDQPILWNGMFSAQTKWAPNLNTSLRLYAHGEEENQYVKKTYPYPKTIAQAAPSLIVPTLSKYITNVADLPQAAGLFGAVLGSPSDANKAALATFLITKGYATPTNVASIIGGMSQDLQLLYLKTNPLPADSVWVTDVHFRSFIANLRTDWQISDDHAVFANLNGAFNDYEFSEYKFGMLNPDNTSLELEVQDIANFKFGNSSQLEWITGGDLREIKVDFAPSPTGNSWVVSHPHAQEWLTSGFVQGKLTLWQQLDLVAGVKGEIWTLVNNDIQWMPSVRAAWNPLDNFCLWGSASRGVTVPGYTQTRMEARQVPYPTGKWIAITSGTNPAKPVDYNDFEIGTRWQGKQTLIDITGYYMKADGRIATSAPDYNKPVLSAVSGDTVIPAYFSNIQDAELYGAEALVRHQFTSWLNGEASYAYHYNMVTKDLVDPTREGPSIQTPEHIAKARASFKLPSQITLSVDGEYLSSYQFLQTNYNYILQKFDVSKLTHDNVLLQDDGGRNELIDLNLTLAKSFFDKQLNISIYGKNLAFWQWGFEAYDYQETRPAKTGAIYGLDAKWGF